MIIGIGGVSRSGKSTLAALIEQVFIEKGETSIVLSQDDFVFPEDKIPTIRHENEVEIDWETPESIDFERYKTAILEHQKTFQHVITEGLLNFYDPKINSLFDKKLFVEIHKNTFLSRKALDERWGKVPDWYVEHIWISYELLGRTILHDKTQQVFVLSGERVFTKEEVIDFL